MHEKKHRSRRADAFRDDNIARNDYQDGLNYSERAQCDEREIIKEVAKKWSIDQSLVRLVTLAVMQVMRERVIKNEAVTFSKMGTIRWYRGVIKFKASGRFLMVIRRLRGHKDIMLKAHQIARTRRLVERAKNSMESDRGQGATETGRNDGAQ